MSTIFLNIFSLNYFGNPLTKWVYSLGIIIFFIILSRALLYFTKHVLPKFTKKTKTDFSETLINLLGEPLAFFVIIIGFIVAFQVMVFDEFIQEIFFNTIKLLILFDITWFIVRFIDSFFEKIISPITSRTKTSFDNQVIPWLKKSIKIGVILLSIIIILDNMGFDVMALIAGLGIGGLAFAFAAQKTIADAFGGVSIIFSRPFVIGDTIKFSNGNHVGKVEEINLRYTKIRNLDKQLVIVPNSIISGEIITNITHTLNRRTVWTIRVPFTTPNKKLVQAKKIIEKALTNCEYCEKNFAVFVEGFGLNSIDLIIRFYARDGTWNTMARARDYVGLEIKRGFEKAGIEFALPTQKIYTKK